MSSSKYPNIRGFSSGGQSYGASASALILPVNIQGCFPLGLTGGISSQSEGLSRVFSSTTVQRHQFFGAQPSLWFNCHMIQLSYVTTGKIIAFTRWTFVGKVMSLLFSTVSRFVVALLCGPTHIHTKLQDKL